MLGQEAFSKAKARLPRCSILTFIHLHSLLNANSPLHRTCSSESIPKPAFNYRTLADIEPVAVRTKLRTFFYIVRYTFAPLAHLPFEESVQLGYVGCCTWVA